MALGLTSGDAEAGMFMSKSAGLNANLVSYGINLPAQASSGSTSLSANNILGVTTDPAKSGLITKFSGLILGTVPSEKLGSFYIRY